MLLYTDTMALKRRQSLFTLLLSMHPAWLLCDTTLTPVRHVLAASLSSCAGHLPGSMASPCAACHAWACCSVPLGLTEVWHGWRQIWQMAENIYEDDFSTPAA